MGLWSQNIQSKTSRISFLDTISLFPNDLKNMAEDLNDFLVWPLKLTAFHVFFLLRHSPGISWASSVKQIWCIPNERWSSSAVGCNTNSWEFQWEFGFANSPRLHVYALQYNVIQAVILLERRNIRFPHPTQFGGNRVVTRTHKREFDQQMWSGGDHVA